jgi:hypothetical protein
MAEHALTTPKPTIRRRRALVPAAGTNVVALPKRPTGADAIVAEVMAESKRQSDSILETLNECIAALRQRHRERVNQRLVPLGLSMDAPMLANFIEIGQRMLAARGGR